ncbi:MAG: sigma-70 family RNA polymerase sigma factor [Actinomycetota bacterium]|jgi:RNA polymerase sigma-70 factor (ECF subfamily)|nr:sigma-70 family RNA polymerase sigma factor [Actinomycetota bacterium]
MQEPSPEVIRAAAAGDLDAFEELMRAYQAHVWRFLRHLLGDERLAEDVTQETFLRVHRSLRTFGFRSKFSTWLFRIARNAGIDALRARQRRDVMLRQLPASRPVSDGSTAVEVTVALASLSSKLREAFVLVEVFGLTYREAGETLGVPQGTVKSRVFTARARLVTWMAAGQERTGEM